MIDTYNGVKYYDRFYAAFPTYLEKAANVLKALEFNKNYSINNIIEFFNITRYFDSKNQRLRAWTDKEYNDYVKQSNALKPIIGKFVNNIDSSNLLSYYEQLDVNYLDDFWLLLSKYQNSKIISNEIISNLLYTYPRCIYELLKYKKFVDYYKDSIKSFMLNTPFSAEILAEKFAVKDGFNYIIPSNLSKEDIELIIRKYITSPDTNLKYLLVLSTAPSSKEFEITDVLKRDIYCAIRREEEKFFKTAAICRGVVSVAFTDIKEISKVEYSSQKIDIQYNRRWFESHLDFIQILFIFKDHFGFCSSEFSSQFVSHPDQVGVLEQIGRLRGKKDYPENMQFQIKNQIYNGTLFAYYKLLLSHDIELQEVFEWFFKIHLQNYLGIEGFEFKGSSKNTTIVEKIKNLVSEMERVLNQYYCYVKEGTIDKELLSIFSQQVKFHDYPSLLSKKYCYLKSTQIQWFAHWLYASHTIIKPKLKIKKKYDTLYEIINNEEVKVRDFYDYQQQYIQGLIDQGYLFVDDEKVVKVNYDKCSILYYAYVYGAFRPYYHPELEKYIKELEDNEDIYYENTLFPHNETEYINYILNNAEFNNGLSIRNKYSHGTYSCDEDVQMADYIEVLKVMLMVIMRINEELVIAADIKEE